jgi:hypothetical protein
MGKVDYKTLRLGLEWSTVLAIVIALISGSGILIKPAIVILSIIGAFALSTAFWEQGWLRAPIPVGTPVRAIMLLCLACTVMAALGWYVYPKSSEISKPVTTAAASDQPTKVAGANGQPKAPQPKVDQSTIPNPARQRAMEQLGVRGEKLCHSILQFARTAIDEEPVGMYGTGISADVMAAQAITKKHYAARISAEFNEQFGGQLAAITKEFEKKDIRPTNHMAQPPLSGYEMELGGQAVCEMVSTLRQKEHIPDSPHGEKGSPAYLLA